MPRLLLHAGFHKTGTTAIQFFAWKNRKSLLKERTIYPDLGSFSRDTHAHHDLAHAIAGRGRHLQCSHIPHLVRDWHARAEAVSSMLFISSEAFCRHVDPVYPDSWLASRRAYLKKVADFLSGFNTSVVIVLRRQDNFVKSIFQEKVMKNNASGKNQFASFRERFLREYEQNSFLKAIKLFEEFFQDVKVLVFEDLIEPPGLCMNFFQSLGVDTRRMVPVGAMRKSMDPRQTIIKIFLNRAITSTRQNKQVLKWLDTAPARELLQSHYGQKKYDLWESFERRQHFLDFFEEENEMIRSRYFPEKKQLFPPLQDYMAPPVPRLSERIKADVALLDRCFENSTEFSSFASARPAISRLKSRIVNFLKKTE